ncbi:MAG: HAD-IA family hydrolase [Alphaproteobacteria bacterium]|nr:HAD-IA family hydrolase [Alphaproteobacteria bacterium]
MKIYDNLLEIADQFDTFLVDAYGVFWDGKGLIKGSAETLETLMKQGKKVCILSNTSAINYSYEPRGLKKGVHYTTVITSGDVFYDALCRDNLPFPGHKIYMTGVLEFDITKGTSFQMVNRITDADLVYFGIPQLSSDEIKQYPELQDSFFLAKKYYNSISIKPFLPKLEQVFSSHLPVVSTNPDLIAAEGGHWMIRQGTLAKLFRDMGGEIFEFGKPYPNIYQYAFQKLGIKPSAKIAMIGDTYRTDIRGGLDAGITPIWCLDTGIAQYEVDHGTPILTQAGGSLDGIVLIHHL